MTIENKENKTVWVEVKQLYSLSHYQEKNPFFTLCFNDWDDKEYIINFDPYDFLNWVDNKTLKEIKKRIMKQLNDKTK